MTKKQLASLAQAEGPAAEKLFLQLLTVHHRVVVEQAEIETRDGRNPAAVALATQLTRTQRAEVRAITTLLATRHPPKITGS